MVAPRALRTKKVSSEISSGCTPRAHTSSNHSPLTGRVTWCPREYQRLVFTGRRTRRPASLIAGYKAFSPGEWLALRYTQACSLCHWRRSERNPDTRLHYKPENHPNLLFYPYCGHPSKKPDCPVGEIYTMLCVTGHLRGDARVSSCEGRVEGQISPLFYPGGFQDQCRLVGRVWLHLIQKRRKLVASRFFFSVSFLRVCMSVAVDLEEWRKAEGRVLIPFRPFDRATGTATHQNQGSLSCLAKT